MEAMKTSGKSIRRTVSLAAGFNADGSSKPRREARIVRLVACPTTGKFDTSVKFYLVEYLDSGEREVTIIQEAI